LTFGVGRRGHDAFLLQLKRLEDSSGIGSLFAMLVDLHTGPTVPTIGSTVPPWRNLAP
jgi:hypothetical protein